MFTITKDSFLAWMVCVGAFLGQIANIGIDNSFGIVLGNVINELNSTTYYVSWIQSSHSTCMYLFASISSFLLKKFLMRWMVLFGTVLCCISYILCIYFKNYVVLFLTYGVIGGMGSGLILTPSFIACSIYFDKWKQVASGIAMSGAGSGTMLVSLICNYANTNFGYTGYFVAISLIGCLNLILVLFAFPIHDQNENCSINNLNDEKLLHKQESEYESLGSQQQGDRFSSQANDIKTLRKSQSYSSLSLSLSNTENIEDSNLVDQEYNVISLLSEKRMAFYCLVHIFFQLAYYLPMVYLPETMITEHNISNSLAGTIISVLGVSNTIGKLLTGSILQWFKLCPILFSAINLLLLCISTTGMTICTSYEQFVIVVAIYGLFLSSIDVCCPLIVIKVLDANKLKDGFGLVMFSKALCPLWGPPIGGALKDWSGSYNMTFYAASGFFSISFSFNVLVLFLNMKHNGYIRIK